MIVFIAAARSESRYDVPNHSVPDDDSAIVRTSAEICGLRRPTCRYSSKSMPGRRPFRYTRGDRPAGIDEAPADTPFRTSFADPSSIWYTPSLQAARSRSPVERRYQASVAIGAARMNRGGAGNSGRFTEMTQRRRRLDVRDSVTQSQPERLLPVRIKIINAIVRQARGLVERLTNASVFIDDDDAASQRTDRKTAIGQHGGMIHLIFLQKLIGIRREGTCPVAVAYEQAARARADQSVIGIERNHEIQRFLRDGVEFLRRDKGIAFERHESDVDLPDEQTMVNVKTAVELGFRSPGRDFVIRPPKERLIGVEVDSVRSGPDIPYI